MRYPYMIILSAALFVLAGCSDAPDSSARSAGGDAASAPAAKAYPVDYCVVSGEKLGSMGDSIEVTVDGQVVKICCKACEKDLKQDPGKYTAILKAAAEGGGDHSHGGDAHEGHNHATDH